MAPRQRRPLIELGHLRCQVMQMWHTYLTSWDKRGYWRGAVEALRTTEQNHTPGQDFGETPLNRNVIPCSVDVVSPWPWLSVCRARLTS